MTPATAPPDINALTCQRACTENPDCKIFYWNGSRCYFAEHLFTDENKFIEETDSIIGKSNCSLPEDIWINSIFMPRPSKDVTPFIIGAVLSIILIAAVIVLLVVRCQFYQHLTSSFLLLSSTNIFCNFISSL